MALTDTIRAILKNKRGPVWSLEQSCSVYDAITTMAEKEVGALLVMEGNSLVGIFSERDYARKIALMGRSSKETLVSEIMSTHVITVSPDHTIGDCMRIMTDKRIRHLPVLDAQGKVLGVVSIGDLVNYIISVQQEMIRHLESYITGMAS